MTAFDAVLYVRCMTSLRKKIERAAKADSRSTSAWIRIACEEKLKRDKEGSK